MFGVLSATCAQITTATPASIWAAMQAAPRWPEVLHDLVDARIQPDGMLAPGAEMVTRARPGTAAVDMSYFVLEAEPPRRLVIESETGEFRSRTEYTIEAGPNGGAILTVTVRAEPVRWLHRISTTVARTPFKQSITTSMQTRSRAMLALAERIEQERHGR